MWRGWEFSKATYLSMTTAGVWDAIAGKDGGARFFLRYQRVAEKRRNHVLEQGVENGMELHRMDSRSRRERERGRERDRQREAEGGSGERARRRAGRSGMDSAKPRHVPGWRPATPRMARDTATLWATWASSWPIRAIGSSTAMQFDFSPQDRSADSSGNRLRVTSSPVHIY